MLNLLTKSTSKQVSVGYDFLITITPTHETFQNKKNHCSSFKTKISPMPNRSWNFCLANCTSSGLFDSNFVINSINPIHQEGMVTNKTKNPRQHTKLHSQPAISKMKSFAFVFPCFSPAEKPNLQIKWAFLCGM